MAHTTTSSTSFSFAPRLAKERRNAMIRLSVAFLGDMAVGMALASACVWMIHYATWGYFMSFLAWLIAALLAMLISQYFLHPTVNFLLSDSKFDDVTRVAFVLAEQLYHQSLRNSKDVCTVLTRAANFAKSCWRPGR